MDGFLVAACFALGLVLGSFANVVIHRVPAGESVVHPPSACPACGEPIAPRDNIPVLSWALLRGRCRHCDAAVSARYPLVELACGLLFAVTAARFGLDAALPAYLLLAWTMLAVAVIDARTRRIPNRLMYPMTPALLALVALAALAGGTPWLALRALLGGLAAFAALLLLALLSPRGMGMGDVKLAGFVGIGLAYLGWGELILGVFGGFLLGGAMAVVLIASRLRGRKDQIPFGPYLTVSTMVNVLWGRELIEAYLATVGL